MIVYTDYVSADGQIGLRLGDGVDNSRYKYHIDGLQRFQEVQYGLAYVVHYMVWIGSLSANSRLGIEIQVHLEEMLTEITMLLASDIAQWFPLSVSLAATHYGQTLVIHAKITRHGVLIARSVSKVVGHVYKTDTSVCMLYPLYAVEFDARAWRQQS